MTIKTDLEWGYDPADYFEARTTVQLPSGQLVVDSGRAICTLSAPIDPVPPAIRDTATHEVQTVFAARRLLNRQAFSLGAPSIVQRQPCGGRHVAITVSMSAVIASAGTADFIVRGANGEIKSDRKGERIEAHSCYVSDLSSKALESPTLHLMLQSFGRSVDDPSNELVHLYELRDAVAKHFGGEVPARECLGVSKRDWKDLGRIANDEPLLEGRHRGRQLSGLRPATLDELQRAREVAVRLLDGFAATVSPTAG